MLEYYLCYLCYVCIYSNLLHCEIFDFTQKNYFLIKKRNTKKTIWFKTRALQVRGAMEIALFIQNIQEERAEVKNLSNSKPQKFVKNVQVALYIFTNQSDSNMTEVKYNENRFVIVSKSKNVTSLQKQIQSPLISILHLSLKKNF